jgi:antitoxin YefM
MKAISYTAARNNLAKTMEMVCEDHDPVIVTRKSNQSVVIMSMEDYESMNETAYLMRSPENVKRLKESIKELDSGRGRIRDLLE